MWETVGAVAINVVLAWWLPLNLAYLWSGLPEQVYRFLVWIHQELWIMVPVPLLAFAVIMPGVHGPSSRFGASLVVLLVGFDWWYLRNWPDENKWKRRGRRLKEKVAVRGGTLVVESATT